MRCPSQMNIRKKSKGMIALCLVLIVLLSATLTLALFDHAHDQNGAGGSCAVCAQIQNTVDNLLKQRGRAAGHTSLAFVVFFALLPALSFLSTMNGFPTLVSLKIRLNH